MRDLAGFRAAVRAHRRPVGRTQQQLARAIGLHPDVLSHKLHGRDDAVLTVPDVIGIVTVLAGWGALVTRADAEELLDLMAVPARSVPQAAWSAPPLAALCGDSREAASRAPDRPPPAPDGSVQAGRGPYRLDLTPLPAPLTALIGRTTERAALTAALATSRLVTLTGVGGTGKTRLALQVASELAGQYPDGVALVDLSPVSDPALLATAIAAALGLAPPTASSAEAYLTGGLREKDLLLVLDNLEQLTAAAPVLSRMLAVAPRLTILATSRVALQLTGEHLVRVPPLGLPEDDPGGSVLGSEAVQLFLARARAARGAFTPDAGEISAIGTICTAVDGLPLAIELAAAKLRLHSPQALLPLLNARLTLLAGGPQDAPRRQQTLRATLDWSYQLLPARAQRLFGHLGVFAGPFDAPAAAAVNGQHDAETTLNLLAELADHSMLESTPAAPPQFQLLQVIREYALTQLAEAGEETRARRHHLNYYLTQAAEVVATTSGPDQAVRLGLLAAAYPNIRAALEFACRQAALDGTCLEEGLRLASAVSPLWQRRGPLAEGLVHLGRLLELDASWPDAVDQRVRATAVLEACALACFCGDYQAAVQFSRRGIELFTALGDHHGLARAHRYLGEAIGALGDDQAAQLNFELALAAARQADDVLAQASACNMLGMLHRSQGRLPEAAAVLRQAVELFWNASEPDGVASALHSLGEAERDLDHPALARELFATALQCHHDLGNKRGTAFALEGLAGLACETGAGQQAVTFLSAAHNLRQQIGAALTPSEQAAFNQVLTRALDTLPAPDGLAALGQGRDQPLADTIASALSTAPTPSIGQIHAALEGGHEQNSGNRA